MAQSTSPSISRSSRKSLEYTSCIDTTISSSIPKSTCGNINAHSSFDFISQPRDCDSLVANNNDNYTSHHRILEHDLHRFDNTTDSNKYTMELNNKKLDRTESISLPTTPSEPRSLSFNHKSHPLLLPETNIDDDDDDDDDDDERFRFISSTEYMISRFEQTSHESILHSKR